MHSKRSVKSNIKNDISELDLKNKLIDDITVTLRSENQAITIENTK